MTGPRTRLAMPLSLIAIAFTFTLATLGPRFDFVRLREVLLLAGLVGAIVVGRAFARGWRPRPSPPFIAILAAQATVLALALPSADGAVAYEVIEWVLATGLGWLVWIELLAARPLPSRPLDPERWIGSVLPVAPLILGIVLSVIYHTAVDGELVSTIDEILYRMQARALAAGSPAFALDPAVQANFVLPQAIIGENGLVSQYPPGWPVILAAAYVLGLERAAAVVLGLVNIVLTQRIGTRVGGRMVGLIAATFMALHPMVLRYGPTYLAHSATLLLLLLATLALLESQSRGMDGRRGAAALLLMAGLLIGGAALVRPLTGVSVGFSIVLWTHLRDTDGPPVWGPVLRAAPFLVLGALPMVGLWAAYHAWVFGDPFTSGYVAVNGELHDLGFGTRGFRIHEVDGVRLETVEFTPAVALRQGADVLLRVGWVTFGVAGPFALAGVLWSAGIRLRVRTILPFLVLPLAHLGYWYAHPRFHFELVPFFGIALGWLFLELSRRDGRLATALVTLVLLGNTVIAAALLRMVRTEAAVTETLHATVSEARIRGGPLLVFVPREAPVHVVARLFSYNLDGVGGDVIVAREADPESNERLLRRYPGYRPFLLDEGPGVSYRLEPLAPGGLVRLPEDRRHSDPRATTGMAGR